MAKKLTKAEIEAQRERARENADRLEQLLLEAQAERARREAER